MRETILTALIVVLSVSGGLCQPLLEIPDNRFEFGLVPQNSTVAHYFWFKSVGTDTLRITEIKTGCVCALMPLEREWIAPGDSMKVGIYWDVERRVGKIGRYPYIFTNAGPDPYRLFLTGTAAADMTISNPVSVRPFKLELPKLADRSIDSLAFVFHSDLSGDVALTNVSFPVEECEIVLPDTLKAQSDNWGYIKVKKKFLYTEFKRSITLQFSDAKQTTITLPIRRKFY
ncbi:MAG: DUF1573 domain-containing protein [candidate division Zixibacteria bacterium]|nr:DUF1573 domain-containing protein [candidate division Zixibacteria bacterium]